MATFANDLSARIKSSDGFWKDMEVLSALALRKSLPSVFTQVAENVDLQATIQRAIQSAVYLSQTDNDVDKGLAQDLGMYAAIISEDETVKAAACNILTDIGNHPGAERLRAHLNAPNDTFVSFLRMRLLEALNQVEIQGKSYAFTDFQHDVWSALPEAEALAVSAPTSAGKSFVVLEYLCQQASANDDFWAVFVAPTRALLSEIHGKLDRRLIEQSQSVRISTIPTLDSQNRRKQIFVLTQERLQVLLAVTDRPFDLVIVDEAQAIGDGSRGMILQDCLEVMRSRKDDTRFLFLAPGAVGFNELTAAIDLPNIKVQKTDLSPVVQNRVTVDSVPGAPNQLSLALLTQNRVVKIGTLSADRGFANGDTRLAAVALALGSDGGSLVYGTGPADAEHVGTQIASDLKISQSQELKDLSAFIRDHVHPRYSLVQQVLKGVGFHYGKMPSLLREALEEAFKSGQLKYLVCTTTLFQGVNLPARSVFIDTPTRGRQGDKLDAAALWNFAGRAGRLGKDIIGNVFLVGYDSWDTKPLSERKPFTIDPSFRRIVTAYKAKVLTQMRGDAGDEKDIERSSIEAASGLLISKAARGTAQAFVNRTMGDSITAVEKSELVAAAEEAILELGLPVEALAINWMVNPFGQSRLLKRFQEKIAEGKVEDLIPTPPSPWTKAVYSRYVGIFGRINRQINGKPGSRGFNNLLASVALSWMNGDPLPKIISKKVAYLEKNKEKVNIDSAIRGVFEFVEDILRFRYVQLGRAYVDLLRHALKEANLEELSKSVYDFPLALELGVSSVAGQAFIELGLSRISAATLESLIPDSNPTVERVKLWLAALNGNELGISAVMWAELLRKGLVKDESTSDVIFSLEEDDQLPNLNLND